MGETVTLDQCLSQAIQWLQYAQQLSAVRSEEITPPAPIVQQKLAWGAKVSPTFRERIRWIGQDLSVNPDYLMACIAWESGEKFTSTVKNMAGSGAVGLIQFMPTTAASLGTTTDALSQLTPEDQLNYVYKYFKPFKGRLNNLGDVYMAILWPKAVGQPDSYVLFDGGTAYRQNAGLDTDKNGKITRSECLAKIQTKLSKGLLPANLA